MNCRDLTGTALSSPLLSSRALHYGDGFFTTMRVYDSNIQLWDYHLDRIIRSAAAFYLNLGIDALTIQVQQLATEVVNGIIKIHVSRRSCNASGYGVDSAGLDSCDVLLFYKSSASTMPQVTSWTQSLPIQPSISVSTSAVVLANTSQTLSGIKTLMRADQILASKVLKIYQKNHTISQVTESLLFDEQEQLVEAISSNVFYQLVSETKHHPTNSSDNHWYTPSLGKAGVAGTMRAAIMDATAVTVRDINKEEVSQISTLFLTNAIRGIIPVSEIFDDDGNSIAKLCTASCTNFYTDLCNKLAYKL